MKTLITTIIMTIMLATSAQAYTIGGAYASLQNCSYGEYGYEYGNIGTYNVNGKIYQVFFGSNYCEY